MTLFLRLLDAPVDAKEAALLEAVRNPASPRRFEVEPSLFAAVPGSPFAYWVSDGVRAIFKRFNRLESSQRSAKVGLQTSDDFRFVRMWWEVTEAALATRWYDFAKGGAFSRFYADLYLTVYWSKELEAFDGSYIRNESQYLNPGLTWALRTQRGFGLRALPALAVFGHKGPATFLERDATNELLNLLAIGTSSAFRYLVELQMAFGSYEVGVIQRTPVPELSDTATEKLATLARRAWSLKRALDTVNETSHAFLLPAPLRGRAGAYQPEAMERELEEIQKEIDDLAFELYGITGADREEIERWARGRRGSEDVTAEDAEEEEEATAAGEREALLSWCVGVTFGRFDIRLATGERPAPPEPDPFAPLPARSPGMVPAGAEFLRPILVDDPGHPDDLAAAVAGILERVGLPLPAEEPSAPEELRAWLAKEFFGQHIRMYSRSRRKAPIYWQLSVPSGRYAIWLHIHAFTRETIFTAQNDYLLPKILHEERRLAALRSGGQGTGARAERRSVSEQETLVEELRAMLAEMRRAAPLWHPNLDDGVLIASAPLWRLFPGNRAWARELKRTWDALAAGAYDWASLAMTLWPERVVPKCADDRSLAIAHGLEETFWRQDDDGKWQRREVPAETIEELLRARTSTAVAEALRAMEGLGRR